VLKLAVAFAAVCLVLAITVPRLAAPLLHGLTAPPAKEEQTAVPVAAQVTLLAGGDGHYYTPVVVNGRSMQAVIDTGASMVALTYEDARALGLVNSSDRFDLGVQTANGVVGFKPVQLNSVRVGGIVLHDVRGTVAPQGALGTNLLGMSFLGRLRSVRSSGGRLVLEN